MMSGMRPPAPWGIVASLLVLASCRSREPLPSGAAWDPDSIPDAFAKPVAALQWPFSTRALLVGPDGPLARLRLRRRHGQGLELVGRARSARPMAGAAGARWARERTAGVRVLLDGRTTARSLGASPARRARGRGSPLLGPGGRARRELRAGRPGGRGRPARGMGGAARLPRAPR